MELKCRASLTTLTSKIIAMKDQIHAQIVADAKELKRLDQSVVKAIVDLDKENLTKIMLQFSELKKQVKTTLIDFPVAKVHDPAAREILIKVNQNELFQTDQVLQKLNSEVGETLNLDALDDVEIEALSSKFYESFSHYEYIEGLFEIGSLIVAVSVPSGTWCPTWTRRDSVTRSSSITR